jgi:PRC-barrel domain protein
MAELPTQRDFEDFSAWSGRDVVAPDGERLGAVEQIFLDEATDVPEWVLVRLDDEDTTAFVPLAGASVEERSIRVEQDREKVAAAPRLDAGETLTVSECRRLYEHYGLAYSDEESPTVLPEGAGTDTAPAEPTEERPRLRKYVGAPVPAAESPSEEPSGETAEEPSSETAAEPSTPITKGTGPAESGPHASAPPTPIPDPAPQPVPPEGGFQSPKDGGGESGGPLSALTGRPAIPIALASAIAALIAVLVVRKRR